MCSQIADTLLKEKGHYIQAINYPTVAKGEEKLRIAPTPHHSAEMIDKFVQDLQDVFHQVNVPKVPMASEYFSQAIKVH